jgi:flagellar assembly factor FliW
MTAPLPEHQVSGTIETRFGVFDVSPDSVVAFPEGLPGFEACRRFVLVSGRDLEPLRCLQALDSPEVSFLCVDPQLVLPTYRAALGSENRAQLGADGGALVWLALVTVRDSGEVSVNLRAPIVINPERMVGYQVMPYRSVYPVDHPLELE